MLAVCCARLVKIFDAVDACAGPVDQDLRELLALAAVDRSVAAWLAEARANPSALRKMVADLDDDLAAAFSGRGIAASKLRGLAGHAVRLLNDHFPELTKGTA